MQNRPPRRPLPLSVVAGVSVLALTTGSAIAWWGWTSTQNPPQPSPSPSIAVTPPVPSPPSSSAGKSAAGESATPAPSPSAPAAQSWEPKAGTIGSEKSPQIYWLQSSGSQIKLVPSPIEASAATPATPLKASLTQLLAGTSRADLTTTIPKSTTLRSVTVRADGIHVDLSQSFRMGGGTTSMTARVAQVLYTATSLDPTAPVWLSVEGKPLESLGGEGLMLEQPMTRKRFEQDFSL